MNYERQILQTLMEAGSRGLSVRKIARHVFNMSNGFFSEVDFEQVHLLVQQYLTRKSARPDGIVSRVSHGIYRLNTQTRQGRQLILQFKEEKDTDAQRQKPPVEDQSLNLFS